MSEGETDGRRNDTRARLLDEALWVLLRDGYTLDAAVDALTDQAAAMFPRPTQE